MRSRAYRKWLAVVVAVVAAGCGQQGISPNAGPTVTLNGAGATFPYPLYSKWFDEYNSINPQVRINYQSIGSGGGIQQLKARTVDFGASDAALSDEEEKAMPGPVVHIPTVAGAVVIAYNLPMGHKALLLDGESIAGVYLGKIKKWSDRRIAALNPGVKLPDVPIVVVHRSDGSGTTHVFTHYLAAVSKEWAGRVGAGKSVEWPAGIGGKGNEGVTGVVRQTPGAIGYAELAYAFQNKLRYAHVRNAAGKFVLPSAASTTAAAAAAAQEVAKDVRFSIVNGRGAEAYPIAGFTYLLAYRNQDDRAKAQALAAFLKWAIGEGQSFAEPLLYAPLPSELVRIDQAAIESLRFQGKPLAAER